MNSPQKNSFFGRIFGQVQWTKPGWVENILRKPLKAVVIALISLLILAGIIAGIRWYRHLPKPIVVVSQVRLPRISEKLDDKATEADVLASVKPLKINFNYSEEVNGRLQASVAPLDKVGKEIVEGISLSPNIPGTWKWENDHQLSFTPKVLWPAAEKFTIHYSPKIFTKGVKFGEYQAEFSTQNLTAKIDKLEFYQDPSDAKIQKIVGTVSFNFPIDPSSTKNKIYLIPQKIRHQQLDLRTLRIPVTLTFGKHNREVYVKSENLQANEESQYYVLVVNKNIQSQNAYTQDVVTQKVLVADAENMLKITDANAILAHDEEGRPQQSLIISSSIGVDPQELQQRIQAYLLPQKDPSERPWWSPREITENVLKNSTPIKLSENPVAIPFPKDNSFRFNVPPGRYIYVKVEKNLPGYGGYKMGESYSTILTAPEYPKAITFLHKGALLALGGEHKLSVLVRGIPKVKYEFARVLPNEINHLITQTGGNYDDPKFTNYNFSRNDLSEIYSETQNYNITDPAQIQYTALDLNKYLAPSAKNPHPLGLFLIKAKSFEVPNVQAETNRLILITDMGLLVKSNHDGSSEVYVQSITQGAPVGNAKISILGRNGLPITSAVTDAQGHVHLPDVNDFKDEQEPVVFVAKKGDDVSFIPYQAAGRDIDYSKFDTSGVNYDDNANNLSSFIFSDRSLYRPGEEMHFGLVIKQGFANAPTPGLPLQAEILDPSGRKILNQKLIINDSGYLNLNFTTDKEAATGSYTLTLYLIRSNRENDYVRLGSNTVRVEEFLPDTMKITSQITQESPGWLNPQNLGANIALKNLIGTPAQNRKVTGKIILIPQSFNFIQYKDYTFSDPLYNSKNPPSTVTQALDDQKTNEKGEAHFDFNLGRFDKATYQLNFYAQGFSTDVGGRGVSTQNTVLVSPLDHLLGYKTDGDFNFIKKASSRSIHLIAINNKLEKIALSNVKLQLLQVKRVASLVKKADGTYAYKTINQESPLNSANISIPADGYTDMLPTATVGSFILEVDENNTTMARIPFTIVGDSQSEIQKNTELNVALDKKEYNSGDTINLQITAPYAGNGLITIERDKVYAAKWFAAKTSNSVQSIQIPANFVGDGYVNVSFVRDWNSPEIFLNPLSYSLAHFTVNRAAHQVNIHLSTPPRAYPGKIFPITYATDKPAKIIVYAVDEGILQAARYQTPDPLGFFFQRHALEVATAQILDLILPKFISERELSAVGGDGAARAVAQYLNPFKRQVEAPVVFWSGILDADNTPRTLQYSVPGSFNGTLRVMAVAVNNTAVGSTDQKALIQSDIMISPNLPTFVAPGDRFVVSANITNNVKNSAVLPIDVNLSTSAGLKIIGEKKTQIQLGYQQEKVLQFTLQANEVLGNATLTFAAKSGNFAENRQSTLSIRPAMPQRTTLISGYTEKNPTTLTLTRKMYPEFHSQTIAAATSPLVFIRGLQTYLDAYPYFCSEQLSSTGLGDLASINLLSDTEIQKARDTINKIIQMLSRRQTSAGAFMYWPGVEKNDSNTAFSSVYSLYFLTAARENGFVVSDSVFKAGLNYLRDFAAKTPQDIDEARLEAMAIYLLTRNQIVTTNFITNLQLYLNSHYQDQWESDILSSYLAASYHLLKEDKEAERLIKGYQFNNPKRAALISETSLFDKASADAAYIDLLALNFPDKLKALGDTSVKQFADYLSQNHYSTISSALTILALSDYSKGESKNSVITVSQDENKNSPLILNSISPMPFSLSTKELSLSSNPPSGFYYQVMQSGFDRDFPSKVSNKNIEIEREFWVGNTLLTNLNIKQGTDITVHLKLRALGNKNYDSIAIVDLLPGGFEIVDNSFGGNYNFVDRREDRIIFFTTASSNVTELTYHIKAIAAGTFVVPPPYASSMYDHSVASQGLSGSITIK